MDFKYRKSKNNAIITEYLGDEKIVNIPTEIDGLTVSKVNSMTFFGNDEIEEIHFPNNVAIENNAIVDCNNLHSVYIADTKKLGNFIEDCANVKIICSSQTTIKKMNKGNILDDNNLVNLAMFGLVDGEEENTCIISQLNSNEINSTIISIPNYINGKKVVGIRPNVFSYIENIKEIVLNDFIEELPNNCFTSSSIEKIRGGNNIKRIGDYCFYNCFSLKELDINLDLLEEIGAYAFFYSSISSFPFSKTLKTLGVGCFKNTSLFEVDLSQIKCPLPAEMFTNNNYLEKAIIPKHMTELPNGFFRDCYTLKEIENFKSVTILNEECLRNCSSFKGITKFTKFTKIGSYALYNVPVSRILKLGNVVLFEHSLAGLDIYKAIFTDDFPLDFLPEGLFERSTVLNVELCSKIKTIKKSCFLGTKLSKINLENIKDIGDSAFCCSRLKELEGDFDSLGENTFERTNIKKVDLSKSTNLKSIPAACFHDCPIEELKLPENVSFVGSYCFSGHCLKTLEIPKALTTVKSHAFSGRRAMDKLIIKGQVDSIGNFEWIKELVLPDNFELTEGIFSGLRVETLDLSNLKMDSLPKECFMNICSKKIILPNGIKKIGERCFAMASINDLQMDYNNIESIGDFGFYNSDISNLRIAENCTYFGDKAYYHATLKQKSIILKNAKFINNYAFGELDNCPKEVSILGEVDYFGKGNFECTNLGKISFEDKSILRKFKTRAFYKRNLFSLEVCEIK